MALFRHIKRTYQVYSIRTPAPRDDAPDIGLGWIWARTVCHVVAFYSISPRLDALTVSFSTGQRHSFFTTSLYMYNGPAHIKEQLCSYQRCAVHRCTSLRRDHGIGPVRMPASLYRCDASIGRFQVKSNVSTHSPWIAD